MPKAHTRNKKKNMVETGLKKFPTTANIVNTGMSMKINNTKENQISYNLDGILRSSNNFNNKQIGTVTSLVNTTDDGLTPT